MTDVNYPIFLSSLCARAPGLKDLRARIFHDIGHATRVYVDEQVNRREIEQQDDLCAADELIARIRQSDHFVCILAGSSHGSPIRVGHKPSSTSFLEIELVQATLLHKNIHLLVRQDFVPEPRMEALLRVLVDAFPVWRVLPPMSDADIFEQVARIRDKSARPMARVHKLALQPPICRLIQAFYTARARHRPDPSIDFLRDVFDPQLSDRSVQRISELQTDIAHQQSEEKKLARLWIALRELADVDFEFCRDPVVLQLANVLLAEWARAGAWYGLHCDMRLGCLAALNSLARVRERLTELGSHIATPETLQFPGGALASAKYSIARRLIVGADRIARLNAALTDVQRSLDNHASDRSGLLSIRGSIMRMIGRKLEAIADYECALQLRLASGARYSAVGEAMVELGYTHLLNGSFRRGLQYCENGIAQLREEGHAGFLARGLKKLAIAYLLSGRLGKARRAWGEAHAVAAGIAALDQL